VYFALYYGLFRVFIRRFNLKTPGREDEPILVTTIKAPGERARAYVAALGGAGNILSVGACTTRLRLVVARQEGVDEAALRALGARGLVRPSERDLQVVIGATADQTARDITDALAAGPMALSRSVISAEGLAKALGGALGAVETRSSRLIVTQKAPGPIDEAAAVAAGARAVVATAPGTIHIVIGPGAATAGAALAKLAKA
ncbi:MAG TPA: glucose PTS transporter subunit EIIB, partial [Caulobacteraceae bacterium]